MAFYVYVIYSTKLDRYYIGHTEDIEKRLAEHNNGLSKYTSRDTGWKLVYTQSFNTRQLARSTELSIKKKKSRKYIEWLIAG